jgi:GrpB-like predicted nucleotidyltransferase (UPF0157 family)
VQRFIKVVPYDPNWVLLFEKEAQDLANVFGDLLAAIHHIGSTSVPGLMAKPVIDIMPVVHNIEKVDTINASMLELGYIPKGEMGITGRRFFIKPAETERTHHVHSFQSGRAEVLRHLAFRDYLITHPLEAAVYGELKRQLAQRYPEDIIGYMDGKDSWIKATEQKAIVWFEEQNS